MLGPLVFGFFSSTSITALLFFNLIPNNVPEEKAYRNARFLIHTSLIPRGRFSVDLLWTAKKYSYSTASIMPCNGCPDV